jgi:hypothetical protein
MGLFRKARLKPGDFSAWLFPRLQPEFTRLVACMTRQEGLWREIPPLPLSLEARLSLAGYSYQTKLALTLMPHSESLRILGECLTFADAVHEDVVTRASTLFRAPDGSDVKAIAAHVTSPHLAGVASCILPLTSSSRAHIGHVLMLQCRSPAQNAEVFPVAEGLLREILRTEARQENSVDKLTVYTFWMAFRELAEAASEDHALWSLLCTRLLQEWRHQVSDTYLGWKKFAAGRKI